MKIRLTYFLGSFLMFDNLSNTFCIFIGKVRSFVPLALSFFFLFAPVARAELSVVATIKPIHSITSAVMAGIGSPHLLLKGITNPHSFTLRPSDAKLLQDADVIIWVNEHIESPLVRPLKTLSRNSRVIYLSDADGITLAALRKGGIFGADGDGHHEDDEHEHDEHDEHEHEHDEHDEHEHDEHEDEARHEEHDDDGEGNGHSGRNDGAAHSDHDHSGHDHGEFNPHIWLDPVNGGLLALYIASELSKVDPKNASIYFGNATKFRDRMEIVEKEIENRLHDVKEVPFLVFHDAYQNFETRFGLAARGSITVNPENPPSAKRIKEMQDIIDEEGVACVFSEPQYDPKYVNVVLEGSNARLGQIDALGVDFDAGPGQFEELMFGLADSLVSCLKS